MKDFSMLGSKLPDYSDEALDFQARMTKDIEKAIEIDPRNPSSWLAKALWEEHFGRKQQAKESYRRFIELSVESIEYARQRLAELEK
jgi:tetratricopeptide (TPR) repeat protein